MTAVALPGLAGRSAGFHRAAITVSVMMATVIQVLDNTIANVALPSMRGSLSASQEEIAWVLTSYIVATAIATPATGYLAGRFGRKRLFIVSVAGFVAASMLCGAAPSLEVLVLARILQGASGAALIPLSQSVLLDSYPRERHGSAMAIWGMGVMAGPILGPTIGGYITELYGWRWVFYINLPVGIVTLLGLWVFLPETARDRQRSFNWFGFTVLALGIGALQAVLDRGEVKGWFDSTEIVVEAFLAALGLYMFLVHMGTGARPFLTPALFRDRNFVVGLIVMPLTSVTLMASVVLMPPFLEDLQGYPAYMVGYLMMPRGFGNLVALVVAGRLVGRVDSRSIILAGLVCAAVGAYYMTRFTIEVEAWPVLWTGFVQGFGLGLIWVPLSTLAFATLEPRLRTEATSIFSLVRNTGASIGISYVIAVLGKSMQANRAEMAAQVSTLNPLYQAPFLPPTWSLVDPAGLAAIDAEIVRQATMIGYLNDFVILTYTPLVAIPLLFFFKSDRRPVPARPVP